MPSSAVLQRKFKVTMSSKGQMVIPAALRAKLGLRSGTGVWIELEEDETSLRLRPHADVDPMSMRGFLADCPIDPLKELEEDRKREIEDDQRMADFFQHA